MGRNFGANAGAHDPPRCAMICNLEAVATEIEPQGDQDAEGEPVDHR